jgi:hypothetical protein
LFTGRKSWLTLNSAWMTCSQRGTALSKCFRFRCPPFGEKFQVGHGNQKFWSSVESHEFLVRVGSEAFRRLYRAPNTVIFGRWVLNEGKVLRLALEYRASEAQVAEPAPEMGSREDKIQPRQKKPVPGALRSSGDTESVTWGGRAERRWCSSSHPWYHNHRANTMTKHWTLQSCIRLLCPVATCYN